MTVRRILATALILIFFTPYYVKSRAQEAAQPTVKRLTSPAELSAKEVPSAPVVEANLIYREYDLRPFTMRFNDKERPEKAVVDWVLRETGYEHWHGEAPCVLCADRTTLKVRHDERTQQRVAALVESITRPKTSVELRLQIVSLGHPDWRAALTGVAQIHETATPGAQAWIVPRQEAARLLALFSRRIDASSQASPILVTPNGIPAQLKIVRKREFPRDIALVSGVQPSYAIQNGMIEEGFELSLSPLLNREGKTIQAVLQCSQLQVEKMTPFVVDAPTLSRTGQRLQAETPQIVERRVQERLAWPADQVLLITTGPSPAVGPEPTRGRRLGLPWSANATRADMLMFIEAAPIDSASLTAQADRASEIQESRTR